MFFFQGSLPAGAVVQSRLECFPRLSSDCWKTGHRVVLEVPIGYLVLGLVGSVGSLAKLLCQVLGD